MRRWTIEEVEALGARTDLVTACQAFYGCGKNTAWSKYHEGTLDFPAVRCGRRVIVPVAPLLALLGLETNGAGAPPPATVDTTPTDLGASSETVRRLRAVG